MCSFTVRAVLRKSLRGRGTLSSTYSSNGLPTGLRKLSSTGVALKGTMNKPLSPEDIAAMEQQLRSSVQEERRYWRVNDVKCDAVYTARTYEEFADRVAAAHLQPLDRKDFQKKAERSWNQYARKDSSSQQ